MVRWVTFNLSFLIQQVGRQKKSQVTHCVAPRAPAWPFQRPACCQGSSTSRWWCSCLAPGRADPFPVKIKSPNLFVWLAIRRDENAPCPQFINQKARPAAAARRAYKHKLYIHRWWTSWMRAYVFTLERRAFIGNRHVKYKKLRPRWNYTTCLIQKSCLTDPEYAICARWHEWWVCLFTFD